MKQITFFFFSILFLTSCSKSTPELSKSDLKFADILAEVYLVNCLANQVQTGSKDSLRTQLTIQLLKAYEMDTTEFYKKLYQMEKNPAKFKLTYDTIVARLENIKNKMN